MVALFALPMVRLLALQCLSHYWPTVQWTCHIYCSDCVTCLCLNIIVHDDDDDDDDGDDDGDDDDDEEDEDDDDDENQ